MRTRALYGAAVTTALAAASLVAGPAQVAGATTGSTATSSASQQFVVLYEQGTSDAAGRQAIAAAGGTVRSSNAKVGYAVADSTAADFGLRAERQGALVGAARNRSIGHAPTDARPARSQVERLQAERAASVPKGAQNRKSGPEPLSDLQWDMKQIGATSEGSYRINQGSKKVMVGIIDTGIDGSHPDIRPNFDAADSRNFTVDMPDIDGPCEVAGCKDPATVDDDGHGTHVASTIGAPINGIGISGVAPNVTLVNIRAGQDSGYFFLQPTLDALTYAGDLGVDVVNMSFYVDPWLYNCNNNPADSPEERAEQKTIRQSVQRAVTYARNKGVLPVAAMGNGATDLGRPTFDGSSPDYPAGAAKPRRVDNSCITVPTETRGVVAVTSTGISERKAYYSDYGIEQADLSAPGGDAYDTADHRLDVKGLVLAAYPKSLAVKNGDIDANGDPTNAFVIKDCKDQRCGYYQYLQGTSMASPHAAGVAALLVSTRGTTDTVAGHKAGLTLAPATTEALLAQTARDHACPAGGTQRYEIIRASGTTTSSHTCEGTTDRNGFYGEGIVDALAAVS